MAGQERNLYVPGDEMNDRFGGIQHSDFAPHMERLHHDETADKIESPTGGEVRHNASSVLALARGVLERESRLKLAMIPQRGTPYAGGYDYRGVQF